MVRLLGGLVDLTWLPIAAALCIASAENAKADAIGDMSCLDVRQIIDDFDVRKEEASKIWHWIGVRFTVDDDAWVAAGHDPVAAKWSPKGLANNEAMVTASCGQYRDDTLAARTDDVYAGLAELMIYLGGKK